MQNKTSKDHIKCDYKKQESSNTHIEENSESPILFEELIKDVTDWERIHGSNNINLDNKYYKFTDMKRERAKSIDLCYDKNGLIDVAQLKHKIQRCNSEFIKVRIPSDADISNIDPFIYDEQQCPDQNNNNTTTKTKRKERPKTIAEYFV